MQRKLPTLLPEGNAHIMKTGAGVFVSSYLFHVFHFYYRYISHSFHKKEGLISHGFYVDEVD